MTTSEDQAARLHIDFEGDVPQRIVIDGRADEPLLSALRRTVGVAANLPSDWTAFRITVPDVPGEEYGYWLGEIDEHVTLGDLAAFADGSVLTVDLMGRGGWEVIPLLWDVIGGVSTVGSLMAGHQAVAKQIDLARTRHARQAAKEWLDAGTDTNPSMALRQYVYGEPQWSRSEFDRTFGLDGASGPALLRRLGYEKTSSDPELWTERRWMDEQSSPI